MQYSVQNNFHYEPRLFDIFIRYTSNIPSRVTPEICGPTKGRYHLREALGGGGISRSILNPNDLDNLDIVLLSETTSEEITLHFLTNRENKIYFYKQHNDPTFSSKYLQFPMKNVCDVCH